MTIVQKKEALKDFAESLSREAFDCCFEPPEQYIINTVNFTTVDIITFITLAKSFGYSYKTIRKD